MKDIKKWQMGCLVNYMSKLEELRKLKEQLQIEIRGKSNIPNDAPSVIISNHNRLMDILYLPLAFDKDIVSLVSSRLVYKKDQDRLSYINKYLNAFPIEAHGGKAYSDICLENASSLLNKNISLSIWPEGAYIDDRVHVYRGRTGASRILFNALNNGSYAYLLPVSIDIQSNDELDNYVPNINDRVRITINDPILPDEYFYRFSKSYSKEVRNNILHEITKKGMKTIADSLQREYVDEYIELFPKGNVIFSDGTTVNTNIAQNKSYIDIYNKDIKELSKKLVNSIQK